MRRSRADGAGAGAECAVRLTTGQYSRANICANGEK